MWHKNQSKSRYSLNLFSLWWMKILVKYFIMGKKYLFNWKCAFIENVENIFQNVGMRMKWIWVHEIWHCLSSDRSWDLIERLTFVHLHSRVTWWTEIAPFIIQNQFCIYIFINIKTYILYLCYKLQKVPLVMMKTEVCVHWCVGYWAKLNIITIL